MRRSTLQHLRIPFSVFLMPFFAFAASQSPRLELRDYLAVFALLHVFLYPASNGFNSYYDRDEGSIGGLEKPPPVEPELLWVSLGFDALALALGTAFYGGAFGLMLLMYGLASKAYSHSSIRLKARPVAGLFTVAIFQGGFIHLATLLALNRWSLGELLSTRPLYGAALSSLLVFGSYPLTQVYQHAEDARRGDFTISRQLGVRGTFYFCLGVSAATALGFIVYFLQYEAIASTVLFAAFLGPGLVYMLAWSQRVLKDEAAADYRSAMRMNVIGSTSMIAGFSVLTFV